MFGRGRTTRAQARQDREWREFVKDLTDGSKELSPAEDERMRAMLESHAAATNAGPADLENPPAERAA
jgi:hypothetical protein